MMQVIEMTEQEKYDMYMKLEKSEVVKMLIECNRLLYNLVELKEYGQSSVTRGLTPIAEWDKFNRCSRRLQNILHDIRQGTPDWAEYKEEFINLRGF